jgi:hypothetical protein
MWQDAHAPAAVLTHVAAPTTHTASPATGWIVVLSIVLGALLVAAFLWLAVVGIGQPPGREGDDEPGSGPNGGGPRRPGPDRGNPSGGAPAWWPEFEREFAAHVRNRQQPSDDVEPVPAPAGIGLTVGSGRR